MYQPQVTIYTLPNCGLCQAAKEYFIKHKIKFKSINVDSDPAAQAEMVKKSRQFSVPVIDIQGKIIVGFQKNLVETFLR